MSYSLLAGLLADRPQQRPVTDPAEWAALARIARKEDVGPLLCRAVRAQPEIQVPEAIEDWLSALYRAATYENLLLSSVRTRVCRRLAERSIPTLLLKGAALAFTCYDDPVTRVMSDLDLLVPRSRLDEAAQTLEEDGFRPRFLRRSLLPMMNRPHLHLVYVHPTTQAVVELHWEIKALQKVGEDAMAEIWAHSLPAGDDIPAHMIRWGHMVPLLCAHMALQHQHATMLWLYDLDRVIRKMEAADVRLAIDAAARWRLVPCTARVLLQVRDLFGTPLPAELEVWAPAAASRSGLQARVTSLALSPDAPEMPHTGLLNLLLNGDWRFLRSMLPAPEVVREDLGLPADCGIASAYMALLAYRLRRSPTQMRRLWRCWQGAPRSDDSLRT